MNISFNLRTNQKDFMSYNNNECDKYYQQNEIILLKIKYQNITQKILL